MSTTLHYIYVYIYYCKYQLTALVAETISFSFCNNLSFVILLLLIIAQSACCMLYMFADSSNNLLALAKHLISIRILNSHIVCSSEITFMHFYHLSFQAYLLKFCMLSSCPSL